MQKPIGGRDFPLFFQGYVDRVDYHEDPSNILLQSWDAFEEDISKLRQTDSTYLYASGKWNIGQVIRHCIDTEKIFAYRALCIARKEAAPIRSFNENNYAEAAGKIHDTSTLMDEFHAVRFSSVLFFKQLDSLIKSQYGIFENGDVISLTSMAYIIVGHWIHHKHVLQERYDVVF